MSELSSIKSLFRKFYQYGEYEAITNVDDNITLTYFDLLFNIGKNFRKFKDTIKAQDRIILYGLTAQDWIVNFWSLVSVGAVVVPVDIRLEENAIHNLIDSIKPSLIITSKSERFKNSGVKLQTPEKIDTGKMKTDIKTLRVNIDHDKPSVIALTSGSWSDPKGAVLSMNNILINANGVMEFYKPKHRNHFLSILPLAHMYELTIGMLIPLAINGHIFYMNELSATKITNTLKDRKITYIVGVPRILELFKKGIEKKIKKNSVTKFIFKVAKSSRVFPIGIRRVLFYIIRKNFGKSLKTFVIGGAELSSNTDKIFQGLGYEVFIGYGLTETAPVIGMSIDQKRKPKEVGVVHPALEYKITEESELIVKGPTVFKGYWPEANHEGFFHTGDLATINNGKLILTGRKKNLLVYPNGDKIYLEDLESIINEHKLVEESAAVVVKDTIVDLIIVPKDSRNSEIEMKGVIKKLPMFVKIRDIIFHDTELPKTHTLKPKRAEILKLHQKLTSKQ